MKKHLIRTLCIAFVLSLSLPMVACDMELGGLVGELLADINNKPGDTPLEEWQSDYLVEDILPDIQTAVESYWEDHTYPQTEPPYTETVPEIETGWDTPYTTEPPVQKIPSIVMYTFDECEAWSGDDRVLQFFAPGLSADWNGSAIVDDYTVEYIRVRGWVAYGSETLGQVGYQINEQEPVYDNGFLAQAEEALLMHSQAIGAGSVTRFNVMIPVRDLVGNHTLRVVMRAEDGTEEVFTKIVMDKAYDPERPYYMADAEYLAEMAQSDSSHEISAVTFQPSDSNGGSVMLTQESGDYVFGDPYFSVFPDYGRPVTTGARYLVIKCRIHSKEDPISGAIFAGSGRGPTGNGDMYAFDYESAGDWELVMIDLEELAAINSDYDLSYLRFDIFNYPALQGEQVCEIGYIATFASIEAAQQYDAEHPYT